MKSLPKMRSCQDRASFGSRGKRVMEGVRMWGMIMRENLVLYRMTPSNPFHDYSVPIYSRLNLVKICILDQLRSPIKRKRKRK